LTLLDLLRLLAAECDCPKCRAEAEERKTAGDISPGELLSIGPDLEDFPEHAEYVSRDLVALLRKHGLLQVMLALGPIVAHMLDGCKIFERENMLEIPHDAYKWKDVTMDAMHGIALLQRRVRRALAAGRIPRHWETERKRPDTSDSN